MPRAPRPSKRPLRSIPIDTDDALDARLPKTEDVFDPAYEAYKLRVAGIPWKEAAQRCGYGSTTTAVSAVSVYLQNAAAQMSAAAQQEALQIEVDRYETILREWWESGTSGHDDKAAAVLLRTLERLDRILRLTEGDVQITRETLVISGDQAEYVAQLKAIAEQAEPSR